MIDYDPHDWRAHFFAIRGSMVKDISARVLTCALIAAGVTVLRRLGVHPEISDRAHVLVGVPLGLLLVFRTNASYERFWEGRKQWGSIVNETRNLARTATVLVADPELSGRIVRWTIAFAWSTMFHLRGTKNLGRAKELLPADTVARVEAARHPALEAAREITKALAEARSRGLVSDIQQMFLDQNVQLLVDCLGACERIRKTPLPFAYVMHLRRAISVYCATLPFALVNVFGYGTFLATALLAYVFFGIEEIGVEIEDPFGTDDNDLPLEQICSTIDGDLRELIPGGAR